MSPLKPMKLIWRKRKKSTISKRKIAKSSQKHLTVWSMYRQLKFREVSMLSQKSASLRVPLQMHRRKDRLQMCIMPWRCYMKLELPLSQALISEIYLMTTISEWAQSYILKVDWRNLSTESRNSTKISTRISTKTDEIG